MTTYAWPGWCVNRFEMRVKPNYRVFTGPYTPSVQTVDFGGERWTMSFDTTLGTSREDAGRREAFFDRLLGPIHRIAMWNLARPTPLGSFRAGVTVSVVNGSLAPVSVVNGSLQPVTVIGQTGVLSVTATRGANFVTIQHVPNRTLKAGDMLGIGGQLVRVMADVTFNVSGVATVEILPRLRNTVGPNTEIIWDKPTAVFALEAEGVPVVYRPGMYEGSMVSLVETL